MKDKILTGISTLMLIIPWTILYLRTFPWALEAPWAGRIISYYAVFMVLSGIFTLLAYNKGRVQNTLMKLCLVFNCVYCVVGTVVLAQIYL